MSIICACFLLKVQAQNYHELLKEGNKWNFLKELNALCYCSSASTFSFTFANDTLIEDISYKKVMCEIFSEGKNNEIVSDAFYAAALREDVASQKVYVKYPNKEDEQILYSFNCQIGDTISIYEHTYLQGKDTITDRREVKFVKNVEDYNFNGYTGKKISVCDTTYHVESGFKEETFTDVWYEGIGSLKSLIGFVELDAYTNTYYLELLCSWNYNDLIYDNENRDECLYAYYTGTEEILNDSKIAIYQSLNKGELIVDSDDLDISTIQIYNLVGNKIVETTQKNVNIANFPHGIYLVKVQLSDNTVYTEKWIKH